MANPPITIGPFANVPAPGSPIRSDWAQQITQYVVDRAPGSIAWIGNGQSADLTFPLGASDIFTAGPPTTLPYPTRVDGVAVVNFGFGAAIINASLSVVAVLNGSVVAASGSPIQAGAGAWIAVAMPFGYTVAANGNLQVKARINVLNMASGVCHAMASINTQVTRTGA